MTDNGVLWGLLAAAGVLGAAGIRSRGSRDEMGSPPPLPPPPPTRYERVKQAVKKGAKKGIRTSMMPLGPEVSRAAYSVAGGIGASAVGAPILAPVAGAAGAKLIDAVDWATREQDGAGSADVAVGGSWQTELVELLLYALPKLVAGGHQALCRPGGVDRAVNATCSPAGETALKAVLMMGLIPGTGIFTGPRIARYIHPKLCSPRGRSLLRSLFTQICSLPSEEVERYADASAHEIARHVP